MATALGFSRPEEDAPLECPSFTAAQLASVRAMWGGRGRALIYFAY